MSETGAVIASRTISLDGQPTVDIELFAPTVDARGNDYQCGYRIRGLGNDEIRIAFGVDSLQALLMAMQRIAIDLYTSQPGDAGQLTWLGAGDLGHPVPETIRDLVPQY
jgi:hypothetical protein